MNQPIGHAHTGSRHDAIHDSAFGSIVLCVQSCLFLIVPCPSSLPRLARVVCSRRWLLTLPFFSIQFFYLLIMIQHRVQN